MTKEQKFYKTLKDIFVGAKIEGEGGFVNLMRIKSSYYEDIEKKLKEDIKNSLQKISSEESRKKFREELFDKLYSFFSRYFSKSGSIYFNYTPVFQNVYDKVYSDEKDVILFWKTRMLYYVKSDRIFNNLLVEFEEKGKNYKFFFDVPKLEYKKGNEKKSLVYQFKRARQDGVIVFEVFYSEGGAKTKIDEIKKELKKKNFKIEEEILERAFKTFEKQSEVDYFINKNAKEFLKEQFKIWLYQYVYFEETEWPKERIDQLQILKDIAFKIIDFISQFEDELVKIWEKPKFVLNSNYVITLDRLTPEIIEKIVNHKNFGKQVKEWEELGIIQNSKIDLFENALGGKRVKAKYRFLSIDTKYFKDLEPEILELFDNLDKSLDGWLIKSENWQALNTILPKFREKVQTIYIDPPFNKEQEADYFYSVKYKDASWITLLENRLKLAKDLLNEKGSIFVRCDYNGNMYVRLLMNEIFGEENFRNEIIIKRSGIQKEAKNKFLVATESLFLYANRIEWAPREIYEERETKWIPFVHYPGEREGIKERYVFGCKLTPSKGRHWGIDQNLIDSWIKRKLIRFRCNNCGYLHYEGKWQKCPKCGKNNFTPQIKNPPKKVDSNWTNIQSYSQDPNFPTKNAEDLLKRAIESTSNEGDLVLDFFLGSGTTTAVAHKLGRKWLGVEMGEHFYSVVLPRMKKVLSYDKSGISKEKDVKEKYNQNKAGGFFKYYELEQYEDTLKRVKYGESTLFDIPGESPYSQYIFLKDKKLLGALKIDYKNKKVKVDLSKLYSNIDIAETLSNLLGKWIKRISKNEIEFEDGEKVDLKNLDYKLIKPLIWW